METNNNIKINVEVNAGNSASTLGGISDSVDRVNNSASKVKSGFNGLSNSINQLTREMPAFANSLNTGFMAISNNLPILIDEINKLKIANKELVATGQPTKSIFAQLATSFFSFQTLISVGITLLTVYGGKMIDLVSNYIKGKSGIDSFNESFKITNEAISSSKVKDLTVQYNELLINIGLAKQGFISKESTLNQYNNTIGKTLGITDDINVAENLMIRNADAYIQITIQKSIAQIALQKATESYYKMVLNEEKATEAFRKATAGLDPVKDSEKFQEARKIYAKTLAEQNKDLQISYDKQIEIANTASRKSAEIAYKNKINFFGDEDEKIKKAREAEEKRLKDIENAEKQKTKLIKEENKKRIEEDKKYFEYYKSATQYMSELINRGYDDRKKQLEDYLDKNSELINEKDVKKLREINDEKLKIDGKAQQDALDLIRVRYYNESDLSDKRLKEIIDSDKLLTNEYSNLYADIVTIETNNNEQSLLNYKKTIDDKLFYADQAQIVQQDVNAANLGDQMKQFDKYVERYKLSNQEIIDFSKKSYKERSAILKQYSDDDQKVLKDQVNQTANNLGALFSQISANQKQGTQAQKEFAIASIVASEGIALANSIASAFSPANPDNILTGGVSGSLKAIGFAAQIGLLFARIDNILSSGNAQENVAINQNLSPRRKFASGGILSGPSHSQGGIKTPFGELEGGEIVLNKNVSQNKAARTIASKLNKQMGGSDFGSNGGDVIKVELANPQYIQARVTDKILSKSF